MKGPILFASTYSLADDWQVAFDAIRPGIKVVQYQPGLDLRGFPYAIAWRTEQGLLGRVPDLEVIFSLGAGVDAFLSDPSLPNVPVVRMVEPGLTGDMVQYVLWQCLYHHRRMWELEEAQALGIWRPHVYPGPWDRKIGLMGLGEIGRTCARKLLEFGFDVRGWSRSGRAVEGVKVFSGTDQLSSFLSETEILVCLLPLTNDTRGILNAKLFERLPKGACLINAARGGHLVDEDLLAAMKSGRIAAATLDVFHQEPLPKEHPFWTTPRLFITPHNAGDTRPTTAAIEILHQIDRFESGLPLEHAVDRARGY